MYYKIENKNCSVYKELLELRQHELLIQEENEKAIYEKTGLEYECFLGDGSQQNFRRVRQYRGFKFNEPDKVDMKIWKYYDSNKEVFIPNKKTKLGREMNEFLLNGLKGSNYNRVFEILDIEHARKFSLPYVEITSNAIILYLDNNQEPKDPNVIEITKTEFNQLNHQI